MPDQPTPSLRSELDAVTAGIPDPIEERIRAGIALVEAGGPYGVPIGTRVPSFTLPDSNGTSVDLADRLQQGPVVLSFYRGDWCPFCNLELRALQARLADLQALGASLLAISPQAVDRSIALVTEADLQFDVLSDLDQSVIAAYNLRYEIDDDSRDLFENVFANEISKHNADGTWRLPIPATFVLDTEGIVRHSYVSADYRTRMEPAAIVAAVRGLVTDR
jgi:peroxiredoxin